MPAEYLLYRHDDGRWCEARLLQQLRAGRRWHVLVTYSTAPAFTFTWGEWADSDLLAVLGAHEPYRPTVDDILAEVAAARLRSALA
jgi:hypothetical protein